MSKIRKQKSSRPPREPASAEGPARADNMDHAVSLLQAEFPHLNKLLLRKLKKLPAFKKAFAGSRIIISEFAAALRAHIAAGSPDAPTDKDSLESRKLIAQSEKLEFELAQLRGAYYSKAEVEAWIGQTQAAIKTILQKVLKNELPPHLEGLRAPEISAKMDAVIAEIVKLIRFCHAIDETAD